MNRLEAKKTSEMDALTFAIGKEKENYNLYVALARETADPKARAVFERMAKEEDEHYRILEQTKYNLDLEEFASRSIWEECGPIEGG